MLPRLLRSGRFALPQASRVSYGNKSIHLYRLCSPLASCVALLGARRPPTSVPLRAMAAERGESETASESQRRNDEPLATAGEDTIAAIVTGPSVGAVAIVRLSGERAVDIARALFRPGERRPDGNLPPKRDSWRPKSHRVHYGHVVDPRTDKPVDEILLLPMLQPRSYTKEDLIEFHTHGGGVCAQRVLQLCIEAGARRARPGEFTLRAFLNGRLDLSQAESVHHLVSARTAAAADSALAGLEGGLGAVVRSARRDCIVLVSEVEARLDFDEDLGPLDRESFDKGLSDLRATLASALDTSRTGRLLRTGVQVALVGRPNVGKSSMLNRWSGSDRAIVTDIAGTTRDIVSIDIVAGGGIPVTLLDTAGLREASDVVEKVGVERSRRAAAQCDVVVFVADAGTGWTEGDNAVFNDLAGVWDATGRRPPCLLCLNKSDTVLGTSAAAAAFAAATEASLASVPEGIRAQLSGVIATSASQGTGMEELERKVVEICGGSADVSQGAASWAVNERQAEALLRSLEALDRAAASVAQDLPMDFWTIDLRQAIISLGEVTGDEVTEEVLDNIFAKFCIGK